MDTLLKIFDPSTTTGALLIGIVSGLISGIILGFFSGKKYETNKFKTRGNNSPIINNSEMKVNSNDK